MDSLLTRVMPVMIPRSRYGLPQPVTPHPSSGLRETPDATFPSRGRLLEEELEIGFAMTEKVCQIEKIFGHKGLTASFLSTDEKLIVGKKNLAERRLADFRMNLRFSDLNFGGPGLILCYNRWGIVT